MIKLCILGSSSAIPLKERGLSSHYLEIGNKAVMIDCGEGTQMQLKRFGKKWSAIDHILISHLHGDHYFGLVSLLSTMHMLERQRELHIYSPAGLEEIIRMQFAASNTRLRFPLHFHIIETDKKVQIFETDKFSAYAFPLKHSVPTYGFLLKEKPGRRNVRKDFVAKHSIPYEWFPRIKAGEDYVDDKGVRYANTDITESPKPPVSYAYLSDTAYVPEKADDVLGVSLMYHESTFLEEDNDKAALRQHSTAKQAARMAKSARAKRLILGHFSTRYENVEAFRKEASEIFEDTVLAYDGLEIEF